MGIPKHKPSAKQKSRAKYQSEKRLEYFKKRREKKQEAGGN